MLCATKKGERLASPPVRNSLRRVMQTERHPSLKTKVLGVRVPLRRPICSGNLEEECLLYRRVAGVRVPLGVPPNASFVQHNRHLSSIMDNILGISLSRGADDGYFINLKPIPVVVLFPRIYFPGSVEDSYFICKMRILVRLQTAFGPLV